MNDDPKQRKAAMTRWKRRMAQEARRKREAYERSFEGRMASITHRWVLLKAEFAAAFEALKRENRK